MRRIFTELLNYWTGNASKLDQRVLPFIYSNFSVRYKTGRDYRVTFKFFDFAANWSFKKLKGSPFQVFRHSETVSKFSFLVFFRKFFQIFFSRIFLMSPNCPFNFFDILQQTGFSKKAKKPYYNFENFSILSLRLSAEFRRSRLVHFKTVYWQYFPLINQYFLFRSAKISNLSRSQFGFVGCRSLKPDITIELLFSFHLQLGLIRGGYISSKCSVALLTGTPMTVMAILSTRW